MRHRIVYLKRHFAGLLALAAALVLAGIPSTSAEATSTFPVFDALLYQGKPDLSGAGLSPIRMVYDSEIWNQGESRSTPNLDLVAEVAKKIQPGSLVCVDIEIWPVNGKPEVRKQNMQKFKTVATAFKFNNPSLSLGFYNALPVSEYWRAIGTRGARGYSDWQQQNRNLRIMAQFVDAVFPSLYTSPDKTPDTWVKSAIANITEAKQYKKPVYVFLWPKYTSPENEFTGPYLPIDFWRLQLETCRKYADGIVIWGGWQEPWDASAPWWVETQKFLQGL